MAALPRSLLLVLELLVSRSEGRIVAQGFERNHDGYALVPIHLEEVSQYLC